MNRHVVIDTNVLVSALLSSKEDSATVQIVVKMLAGEITPLYSEDIINEYREVLKRPKFGFAIETIDYFLSAIEKYGILVEPVESDCVLPDINDVPFYEVILVKGEGGAYLVTGNIKHFPEKPFVVTPRQMLQIINSVAGD